MKSASFVCAVLTLAAVAVLALPAARSATPNGLIYTANIADTADTYVDSGNATTNYGANTLMFLQNYVNRPTYDFEKQVLIFFPVTTIPSNAIIYSAQMQLFPEEESFGGLSTIQVDTYTNGATFTEGAATWNVPGTGALTKVGIQLFTPYAFTGEPLPIAVTSSIASMVAGSLANHGFTITFDTSSASTALWGFFSKEIAYPNVRPNLQVTYGLPAAAVYPAYYCSYGPCEGQIASGSGLPAYLFAAWVSENNGTLHQSPRSDIILTNTSTYLRLQVRDFWGNVLYDASKVVTATPFLWKVAIPYALLNAYNMRDAYTNMTVQPAGGTPMVLFLPPRGWFIFPLHSGTLYFLNFTLYDSSFATLATINIQRTMPTYGLAYLVNGTTLEEVSQNVNNVWSVTNTTRGVTTGLANVLLGPKTLDLFGTWLTFSVLGREVTLTLWAVVLFILIAGWVAWTYAYRKPLKKVRGIGGLRKLTLRANSWLVLLVIVTLFEVVTWVFRAAGASVTVPWYF